VLNTSPRPDRDPARSTRRAPRVLPARALALAGALVAAGLAASVALPPPNIERAVAAQRELLAQDETPERSNDLGNLLLLAEDPEGARAAYERAIELDETVVSAHYNLGLLLQQLGRERTALRHLREVVELAPEHAQAWFQIGVLHEAAGAEGPAVRAYARAYLLDPRLSFSDVNPQVLDSRLTTRALLEAQEGLSTAAEAPLAYAEPRRIAGLLLPALPEGASEGAAPAPAATPEPATAAAPDPAAIAPPAQPQSRRPAPILPPGMELHPTGQARVLGPQDLEPGSRVGEVTGGGARGTVTHLPADPESTDYSELLRQRLLQQQQDQGYQEAPEDEVYVEGEEAPEVLPDGTFVPSPRSTGQLEYHLEDQLASLPN
jgi:Tfp pilus assembly protein PilF